MSKAIHTYEAASARLVQLIELKSKQEVELKNNLKEVYENFQPKNLIKKTVKDLANDKEFKQDGLLALEGLTTDMIVGRLFNKNNTVRGFIATILVEKLALPFLKKNKDKILSFVTQLLPTDKSTHE